MNAPGINPLKRDTVQSSRSQSMTERDTTRARVIVCLKKTHVRVFLALVFSVHFVAKQYIIQQKCLNGQIETRLLGTC